MQQNEVLYEVSANSENWMIAGRKRGYADLSKDEGGPNPLIYLLILYSITFILFLKQLINV